MSTTAVLITVSYVIACVLGSIVALVIWRSTLVDEGEIDHAKMSRRETGWLAVVVVGLLALLIATIFAVPYGASAGPDKQVVRVTGVQYAWAIDPPTVKADTPVEFLIGTRDVNHGFGVYDPDGALLTQVQVVPERTQKLVWTFHRAGTYEIRCLEFCGVKHHEMVSQLEVEPA